MFKKNKNTEEVLNDENINEIKEIKEEIKEEKKEDKKEKVEEKTEIKTEDKSTEKKENESSNLPVEKEVNEISKDDIEKLEKIKDEMKSSKRKNRTKETEYKFKLIFINILIAIAMTIFLALVMLGYQRMGKEELITDLKFFIVFAVLLGIVLLEIAYRKDSGNIFLNGLEVMGIGGVSIYILDLLSKNTEDIFFKINIIMAVIVGYYLIKSLIIRIRKFES